MIEVGDIVKVTSGMWAGEHAIVVRVDTYDWWLLEFPTYHKGRHNGDGFGQDGHFWFMHSSDLERIPLPSW